jgi:hypothetical protein
MKTRRQSNRSVSPGGGTPSGSATKRGNEEMLQDSPPLNYNTMVKLLADLQAHTDKIITDKVGSCESKIDRCETKIGLCEENLNEKINQLKEAHDESTKNFHEKLEAGRLANERIANDVSELQEKFNELEQEKLNSHMEISGLESLNVERCSSPIDTAKNVFEKLGILVNPQFISHAFTRHYTDKKGVNKSPLTVVFTSSEIMLKAISDKVNLDKGKKPSVFFSPVLTKRNRALFMRARQVAKNINAKAYVISGRIYMRRELDKRGVQIKSERVLDEIENTKALPVARFAGTSGGGQASSSKE